MSEIDHRGDNHLAGNPIGGGDRTAPAGESAVERARSHPRLDPSTQALVDLLNDVLAHDAESGNACQAAADRLDDSELRYLVRELMVDHDQHITALSDAVRALGGEPAGEPDWRRALTRGKLAIAEIAGDRTILETLRANAEETHAAYGRALSNRSLPGPLRAILQRGKDDADSHRQRLAAAFDAH